MHAGCGQRSAAPRPGARPRHRRSPTRDHRRAAEACLRPSLRGVLRVARSDGWPSDWRSRPATSSPSKAAGIVSGFRPRSHDGKARCTHGGEGRVCSAPAEPHERQISKGRRAAVFDEAIETLAWVAGGLLLLYWAACAAVGVVEGAAPAFRRWGVSLTHLGGVGALPAGEGMELRSACLGVVRVCCRLVALMSVCAVLLPGFRAAYWYSIMALMLCAAAAVFVAGMLRLRRSRLAGGYGPDRLWGSWRSSTQHGR